MKLADCIDSLPYPDYAPRALKIITMQGQLVPLDFNYPQKIVHDCLEDQREAGFPMRAIILKARREGVSTYVSGRFFREINRKSNRFACVASADIDATIKVFKMITLFQDEIPEDIKRETVYMSRKKDIVYAKPHRSEYLCQTAGTDVLGRGGLTHYLHCTEVAFWSQAKKQLGGAMQEVPDDPETIIILESTANGTGGAFYDIYLQAVDRWKQTKSLDGFIPIFLPWTLLPAYSRPVPAGWRPDAEEKEVQSQHSLSDEQLYWRHWAIENKCQGDLSLFKQEYPITWQEAFQASGSPVFIKRIIDYQKKFLRNDIRYGLFDHRDGSFIENKGGSRYGWQYLDVPGSEEHVIGVDTREHKLSDEGDIKSERDFDGVVVLGRGGSRRLVKAVLHCKMGQKELGLQVLGAAKHFNNAWVVPEIPMGMMVVQVLADAGYPNLYHRQVKEFSYNPEDGEDIGFRTTAVTRHYLVNDMISCLRGDMVLVQFSDIVDQMEVFAYDKLGRPRHMAGRHDDLMFGLSLAIQGDLQCPKLNLISGRNSYPEFTGESGGYSGFFPSPQERTLDSLAVSGAYDDLDDEDYGDDAWYFTE